RWARGSPERETTVLLPCPDERVLQGLLPPSGGQPGGPHAPLSANAPACLPTFRGVWQAGGRRHKCLVNNAVMALARGAVCQSASPLRQGGQQPSAWQQEK